MNNKTRRMTRAKYKRALKNDRREKNIDQDFFGLAQFTLYIIDLIQLFTVLMIVCFVLNSCFTPIAYNFKMATYSIMLYYFLKFAQFVFVSGLKNNGIKPGDDDVSLAGIVKTIKLIKSLFV